jgi:nitrite reductase (NADH) small subunit
MVEAESRVSEVVEPSHQTREGDLVEVGEVDEFPEGRFAIRKVNGQEIGVARVGDRWYAARNVCPHQGAPVCLGQIGGTMLPSEPGKLVFGLSGQVVRCPWHRWEFDLETGRVLFTHERGRLRTYRVVVDGDRVLVDLGARPRG